MTARRCVCGDPDAPEDETLSAPSPGWRPCPYRPLLWKDVPLLLAIFREPQDTKAAEIFGAVKDLGRALSRKIHALGVIVSVSVDELNADIQALVAGYQAKDALIAQLQAELASADADAQARVDAAVAAEDADAQAKIDAADAVVDAVINPPAPVDTPPADGGDVPPADDGSGDAPVA